jgi:hypothetical protein
LFTARYETQSHVLWIGSWARMSGSLFPGSELFLVWNTSQAAERGLRVVRFVRKGSFGTVSRGMLVLFVLKLMSRNSFRS